jgi:hypothetical protein
MDNCNADLVLDLIESVTLGVLGRLGNDREARYAFFRGFVELARQSIQVTAGAPATGHH